jgi:hypothetical protein
MTMRPIILSLLAMFVSAPAWAEGVVRAGAHPGHGRIVFEGPKAADVEARQSGDTLRFVFAEPFDGSLADIARRLPDYVASTELAPDKLSALLVLKRPVALKTTRHGTRAIFDIVPAIPIAAATPEKLPPDVTAPPTELRPEGSARGGARSERPSGPALVVRWGVHPTYDRLVIEGASDARVSREGDVLAVSIGAEAPGVAGFRPGTLRHVRAIEAKDGILRATLAAGASVVTRRSGSKLIFDIGVGLASQEAVGLAQLAPAAGPEAKATPSVPAPSVSAQPSSSVAQAAPAKPTAPASSPAATQPAPAVAAKAETPKAALPMVPAAKTAREAASLDTETVSDMSSFFATRERDTVVVRAASDGGAAAFHRAGALWLVFSSAPPVELQGLERALKGFAGAATRVVGRRGGAVRIAGADTLHAHVRRDQGVWVIELSKNRPPPPKPLLSDPRMRSVDGVGLLATTGVSAVVELKDPEVGDRLLVALAAEPELGHPVEREIPELQFLASPLGLAMAVLADGVAVARGPEGLVLSGVRMAETPEFAAAQPSVSIASIITDEKRLFDLTAWRRNDLGDTNQAGRKLRWAAALAKPDRRNAARLDLAHLWFARGLPRDALAALQTAIREEPALAETLEVRAFRGALRLLTNDIEGARQDLAAPALDSSREAALWRALLAQRTGEAATAARGFAHGVSLIPDYPQPYKSMLALAAAEAALDDGAPGQATAYLDTLRKEKLSPAESTSAQLFRARILAAGERAEDGVKQLARVRRAGDPKNVARAALAQVEAGLAQGKMPRDEAIAELEAARFAWRGDVTELAVLRKLGALHLEEGNVRKGLSALRVAITHFPQHREAPAIAREMQDAFGRAFLDGAADAMPLVSALALYNDFSELSPGGDRGDEIVARLAKRMVKLDLLDQAASLLERKLQGRTAGEARARMGAQLAEIRLLDEKYQAALRAIEVSGGAEMGADLAKRRAELRARALSGMGRHEEAAGLFRGDDPADAELRADLLWQGRQWAGVAGLCRTTLGGLAPGENRLAEADERRVLRCAIASALANDEASLAPIRAKFGAAMGKGPMKDAFLAVSTKPNAPNLLVLAQQLGDVKPFKALAFGQDKATN